MCCSQLHRLHEQKERLYKWSNNWHCLSACCYFRWGSPIWWAKETHWAPRTYLEWLWNLMSWQKEWRENHLDCPWVYGPHPQCKHLQWNKNPQMVKSSTVSVGGEASPLIAKNVLTKMYYSSPNVSFDSLNYITRYLMHRHHHIDLVCMWYDAMRNVITIWGWNFLYHMHRIQHRNLDAGSHIMEFPLFIVKYEDEGD